MIEQSVNPQASVAALKGLGAKGGKAVQGGLFAKLMAAFQAQIKQGSTSSLLTHVETKGEGVRIKGAGLAIAAGKGAGINSAKASATLLSKLNRAEGSESEAMPSTMEGLIAANSDKVKSSKSLKDELFLQFKTNQSQHGVKQAGSASDEEVIVAGLGEVHLLQSQKESLSQKSIASGGEEPGNKKGQSPLLTSNDGEKSSTELKGSKAGHVAAQEKGTQTVTQIASKGVIENLTADDWLAANSRKSSGMETMASAKASTPEKGALAAELASKVNMGSDAEKSTSTNISAKASIKGDGVKQSQFSQISPQMGVPDLPEGEVQDQSRTHLQRSTAQVAEQSTRKHQESVNTRQDQAEPVANVAKGRTIHFQQIQASQAQAGGVEKLATQAGGFGSSTSQQDMNSNSQQADPLLADASKADSKGTRGADFASQMHYKTAQVYKPAEAMIEIARSAKDGSMKLEMQLEPAHLGRVQVTLQSDAAKQLQVHINVDQAASRQVIEQHLPQLRAALAEQGLNLGNFSMNMNSQSGQDGTGASESGAFSEFTVNGNATDGSHESVSRIGINRATDGHLSILA